ncbi:MAG: glycosyltransferase [Actinomycetota bacterium]|nr:glycosyltransferase [Actinomycetota bacterium]
MDLAVYVPLGILGLIRWCCWLIRRIPASLYRPFRSDHREPMTVVTPVYQEDPDIFRAAIESWLANNVDEVICVIDVTDERAQTIAAEYPVRVIVTDVPGKRDALRKGWEAATTPLVALVDSDTIWARDVADRVCEPFANPSIGGVGTRQNVYNPEGIWQYLNDMYLDYRYFDEVAAQSIVGAAVSCLSGRTAVYRREVLLRHSEAFLGERFLGVQCNSGEDKRLTTLLLEHGERTYMQRSARVWSTFPRKGRSFYRQRLRWSRNTWRSDLRALGRGWVFKYPFLAFTMLDKAVSSFTLLVSPIYMGYALVHRNFFIAGALAGWWMVSRSAKLLPHLQRRPRDVFLMPVYILVSFTMALVKIYALLTLRKQLWLTRDVAVIDGELVRTNDEEESAGPKTPSAPDRAGVPA